MRVFRDELVARWLKGRLCQLLVLTLTGMALIFSIVAGMDLCFGFVLKTALITQGVLAVTEQCLHTQCLSHYRTGE